MARYRYSCSETCSSKIADCAPILLHKVARSIWIASVKEAARFAASANSESRVPVERVGASPDLETACDISFIAFRIVWRVDCHKDPGSFRMAIIGSTRAALRAGK